jgi:hypothetical protein
MGCDQRMGDTQRDFNMLGCGLECTDFAGSSQKCCIVSVLLFAVPGTYKKDEATSFMEAETTARVCFIDFVSID